MGAQCVRQSPKPQHHSFKMIKEPTDLRGSQEQLQFQLSISSLQLHCTLNNINRVVFRVKGCFQLSFQRADFTILEKIIKCPGSHSTDFQVNARDIQFLDFEVLIYNSQGSIVEKFSLKMHAICQGPTQHDHLLKQMKARLIFNLDISQKIMTNLHCSSFTVRNFDNAQNLPVYAYSLELLSDKSDSQQVEKKIILIESVGDSETKVSKMLTTKQLKDSFIRITLYKLVNQNFGEEFEEIMHMHFPYMKLSRSDDGCLITDNLGKSIQKRKTVYTDQIKQGPKLLGNIQLQIISQTSKIYLQQMDCFVYSQDGVKIINPLEISPKKGNNNQGVQKNILLPYIKTLKTEKKVTYTNKTSIQNTIKSCLAYLDKSQIKHVCNYDNLSEIQIVFVDFLNVLGELITEGQDITNQTIWELIDQIIHRPQLSTKCLYLIQNRSIKDQIGIKYYSFICNMISKIILCTTVGLQFRELKCIQKFIAYTYFRFPYIQKVLNNAIKRQSDQILSQEKLMEIGAFPGCRSPSKTLLYDWEQCFFNYVQNLSKYKQKFNDMLDIAEDVPQWAQIIFNRDDDQLFYGLFIQLWNQAQLFLSCNGKILWEYFPSYGDLLGAFLGEMQSNQIIEYGPNFMDCSIKLMSNQKLLNIFVKLLFQKTHLYKMYYVLKALQIIRIYFEAISKQNKTIPKQFNFNYFYTGITSIFQSNHSILLIKVLVLLYDYYHIFSLDFKRMLDKFIFKRAFFQIFLHWCGYVRKIFYHFLEHRIASKFRIHQKNVNSNVMQNLLGFQSIQMMHSYQNLLYSLQQEQKECDNDQRKNLQKNTKGVLYIKMKQKIAKRQKEPMSPVRSYKYTQMSQSAFSKFSPDLQTHRHKRSFVEFEGVHECKMNRKYSTGTQFTNFQSSNILTDSHRRYIPTAMRQYRQIKKQQNPDKKVRQIVRRYEGNKQTQIS